MIAVVAVVSVVALFLGGVFGFIARGHVAHYCTRCGCKLACASCASVATRDRRT